MKTENPVWHNLQYETDRLFHFRQFLNFRSDKYSRIRLTVFAATVLIFFVLFIVSFKWTAVIFFITGILTFSTIVHFHNKFLLFTRKVNLLLKRKQDNLARIELDWDKIPTTDLNEDLKISLFNDLDITGSKSLLRLLDDTVSVEGKNLLVEWLSLKDSDLEDVKFKSNLVQELRAFDRFRDRLYISMNLNSKKKLSLSPIREIIKRKDDLTQISTPVFILSIILVYSMITLFVLKGAGIILSSIWIIPLGIYLLLYFFKNKKIEKGFEGISVLSSELNGLTKFLKSAESLKTKELKYTGNILNSIFNDVPSKLIEKMESISTGIAARENLLMKIVLNLIFPWDIFHYRKLSSCIGKLKGGIDMWIESLTKLDAFNSLAGFSYLNPAYTTAEISSEPFLLELTRCGHPLIKSTDRIANDFRFETGNEIVMITGSNMSGKSTFLRTIGLNMVLAYNGAPVCADKIKISFYDLFTCIRINDSISEGISYFYSEVKRLKKLYDHINIKQRPNMLFLIDEIFKGTNNIERLQGSRDFIKAIAGKNSCGFVSTHDLDLTKLESEISTLRNFHFREDIQNNVMHFDYKLRTGACPTTNALKLMQSAGLPVNDQ